MSERALAPARVRWVVDIGGKNPVAVAGEKTEHEGEGETGECWPAVPAPLPAPPPTPAAFAAPTPTPAGLLPR